MVQQLPAVDTDVLCRLGHLLVFLNGHLAAAGDDTGVPLHMAGMTVTQDAHWLEQLDLLTPSAAAQAALDNASLFERARLHDVIPDLIGCIESGADALPLWIALPIGDRFLLHQIAPRLVRAMHRMESDNATQAGVIRLRLPL